MNERTKIYLSIYVSITKRKNGVPLLFGTALVPAVHCTLKKVNLLISLIYWNSISFRFFRTVWICGKVFNNHTHQRVTKSLTTIRTKLINMALQLLFTHFDPLRIFETIKTWNSLIKMQQLNCEQTRLSSKQFHPNGIGWMLRHE